MRNATRTTRALESLDIIPKATTVQTVQFFANNREKQKKYLSFRAVCLSRNRITIKQDKILQSQKDTVVTCALLDGAGQAQIDPINQNSAYANREDFTT